MGLDGQQWIQFLVGSMGVNEVRRAVAAKWSKIEYRSLGNENPDSSASSTDLEEDSGRPAKKAKKEVIDLTSDDDENVGRWSGLLQSPFRLIRSDVYDGGVESSHFITFREIFGDKRLRKSILFSFQYELDFLLEQFHPKVAEIVLVAQKGTIRPCTTESAFALVDRLSLIEFYMPQYTCHHSKMIVNLYEDGSCRLFLPSNNLTYAEANYPQQVCWCSPILPRSKSAFNKDGSRFQNDLLEYLKAYGNKDVWDKVAKEVKLLDFSLLEDVSFIFSAPTKDVTTGFQALAKQLLDYKMSRVSDDCSNHYLCQTSTMGAAVSRKSHANLFTHVFIPVLHAMVPLKSKLMDTAALLARYKAQKIVPYIVYPTVEEIRTSPTGWLCSGWFHFNYNKDEDHYKMLAEDFSVFYKQDPRQLSANRRATPSHSKFYMKSTSDANSGPFKELDWCLYTSANLSITAWGTGTARPRNYEVGVLYKSGSKPLACESFSQVIYTKNYQPSVKDGSQVVLVPFTLPMVKYDIAQGDEAFCMAKDYKLADTHGIPYQHH